MEKIQLIQEIKNANSAYASGFPYLSDTDYDLLWQQLFALEPDNPVLYHTANNPNLGQGIEPHSMKVKGTHKAFNQDDLLPFLARFGSKPLQFQPKYDGCAGVLYRQAGGQYKLLLEGDGINGRNITHHLKHFTRTFIPSARESVELIIPMYLWKEEYGANPRNTMAGWLNRATFPKDIEVEMVAHNKGALTYDYLYDGDIEALSNLLLTLYTKWKALYPIDGIMIKVIDDTLRLTVDDHPDIYNWSIAWKPPIQTAETTVTDIEWNVSRTGRIIPTIIYEPIELCGTINTRVTGNNAQWIIDKHILIHSKIIVGKAGEIIPKIVDVIPDGRIYQTIKCLEYCPVCNADIIWEGKDLICDSENCIAKLIKSISFFYSEVGIYLLSIGDAMIESLLKDTEIYSVLSQHPYALLNPKDFKIYERVKKIWGQARFDTYITNLKAINGTKNACHFIAGLGYKGLAYKTAFKIYNYLHHNIIKSHIPKNAATYFTFAYSRFLSQEKLSFKFLPVPAPPKLLYCITGTLSTSRSDMITYLEGFNWQISNQISKFVSLLISGDKPGKTKTTKANELNIPIINEDQLTIMIKKEKENAKGTYGCSNN